MRWKETVEKLSKIFSCSKLRIILPRSCPTNFDERNPNLYTSSMDMDCQCSQILLDRMSYINIFMDWIPSINYGAHKRRTKQK